MKFYPEMAQDPMVKPETVNLLKENAGRYLCDLRKGEDFIGHGKQ